MINEEDEAYEKSVHHTLSERLFTLVQLKIKATYLICLHLVKIILCEWYFLCISEFPSYLGNLILKKAKENIYFKYGVMTRTIFLFQLNFCAYFSSTYMSLCIFWEAIKFSSFSHIHNKHVIIWQLINFNLPNRFVITAISLGLSVSLSAIV